MANYGVGASLASMGMNEQAVGMQELGNTVQQDAQRNASNTEIKAQAHAGNMQLGASVGGLAGGAIAGAEFGTAAGPYGMIVGGLVGALAGGLFN